MPLPTPVILHLAAACAPIVSPTTLAAVVRAESAGDPLAIGINKPRRHRVYPRDEMEAIRMATRLLVEGADFDLGLGQINSRNLAKLRMSVADAFNPCRNLEGAARILTADYALSAVHPATQQAALRTSLSLYNTGDRERGFRNGYVARVVAAARQFVPTLNAGTPADQSLPSPPAWDVFAAPQAAIAGFVLHPQTTGEIH